MKKLILLVLILLVGYVIFNTPMVADFVRNTVLSVAMKVLNR